MHLSDLSIGMLRYRHVFAPQMRHENVARTNNKTNELRKLKMNVIILTNNYDPYKYLGDQFKNACNAFGVSYFGNQFKNACSAFGSSYFENQFK